MNPPAAAENESDCAVVLIAHGSRRAEANDDLQELARLLRDRTQYAAIEPSYLELCPPTIAEAARTCVAQGARRVLMLPYFLSAGRHVVEDLQRHRAELSAAHPDVEFRLCPPLGLHPRMIEIVLERLTEIEQ